MNKKQRPRRNRLRMFRRMVDYKQKDVAKILNMKSAGRISRWEKGLSIPHLRNLFRISSLFKVFPHEIYPELYAECEKSPESVPAHLIALRDEGISRRALRV